MPQATRANVRLRQMGLVITLAASIAVFPSVNAVAQDVPWQQVKPYSGKSLCERDFKAACVLQLALNVYLGSGAPYSDEFLTAVAVGAAVAGDVAGAFKSLNAASMYAARDAIPSIMAAMVRAGKLDDARAKAHEFLRDGDAGLARLSIVRALIAVSDFINGIAVARSIEKPGGRSLALANIAASGLLIQDTVARDALFVEAVSIAKTIVEADRRADSLFQIGALQLAVGDVKGARETIDLALSAAQDVIDIFRRSYVMRIALEQFEKAQHSEADQVIVNELRSAMARIDESRTPVEDFLDAAKLQFEAGNLRAAIDILDQASIMALASQSRRDRGYFLVRIIADRSEMGDVDGALADWALMPDGAYASGWKYIAVAQAKVGDIEGLQKLLKSNLPETSNDPVLRYKIVPALAQNGYLTQARDLTGTMDGDHFLYREALIEIASAEAAMGDFEAAFVTARSFGEQYLRARTLVVIAAEYISRGRVTDARNVLMEAYRAMTGRGGIDLGSRDPDGAYLNRHGAQALLQVGALLAEIEAGR